MANYRFDLKNLSNQELFALEQQILAEEIRRVEQDPNSITIEADALIEEDLKALKLLFNKSSPNQTK
jgi:hypothetical protein